MFAGMMPQSNINPTTGLFSLSPQSRRQNLFQAMIPAGLGLIAASGPSTDPGAFSKGLAATGQNLFTNVNALNNQALQNRLLQMNYGLKKSEFDLKKKAAERQALARAQLMKMFGPQGSQSATSASIPMPQGVTPTPQAQTAMPQAPGAMPQAPGAMPQQQSQDIQVGPMGFVDSPGRRQQLALIAAGEDPSKNVGSAMGEFRKRDAELVRDARERVKKPFEDLRKISIAKQKAVSSLARQDGQGDLAAITTIQRMIDDGIVRKEDMDNWARTLGAAGGFKALLESWRSGQTLLPENRTALRSLAVQLFDAQANTFIKFLDGERELARQNYVPWSRVSSPFMESFRKTKKTKQPRITMNITPAAGSTGTI